MDHLKKFVRAVVTRFSIGNQVSSDPINENDDQYSSDDFSERIYSHMDQSLQNEIKDIVNQYGIKKGDYRKLQKLIIRINKLPYIKDEDKIAITGKGRTTRSLKEDLLQLYKNKICDIYGVELSQGSVSLSLSENEEGYYLCNMNIKELIKIGIPKKIAKKLYKVKFKIPGFEDFDEVERKVPGFKRSMIKKEYNIIFMEHQLLTLA